MIRRVVVCAVGVFLICCTSAWGVNPDQEPVVVGVPTVLSGELAVLGDNIRKTIETYSDRHLRYPISFVYEDARIGSMDGLRAYQVLINQKKVSMLIGGTSSNGSLAGAPLINTSHTVMITPLTGGSNIDQAGPYIFRIGSSDIRNAQQQSERFLESDIRRVALLTEETEYTQDIAQHFRKNYLSHGGAIVYDEDFLPGSITFRPLIAAILSKKPQAIFVGTQTGVAFGLFMKELRQVAPNSSIEVHTNFLAASNSEAFTVAGSAMNGVYYMAPAYDASNPAWTEFLADFRNDHHGDPAIPFHCAGTVDALNLLQAYLDTTKGRFNREDFRAWLLGNVRNYHGLMGTYTFDDSGNADTGFSPAEIHSQ